MGAPEHVMTDQTLDQRSGPLRAETLITDAVLRLGLLRVILTAIRAWWSRPRLPPNLPDTLRADIGLPPAQHLPARPDPCFTPVDFDRYR